MTARIKINIKVSTILSALLFILCLSLCFSKMKMTAYAGRGDFSVEAQMLPSNNDTLDISVTVENKGDDWEGVVRIMIERGHEAYTNCAYDTAISLPQGSVKQFVVKVPKYSYNSTTISGTVEILLVDKNSKPVFSKEFDKLLLEAKGVLKLGILSDDYSALTFMDMGGDKLSFYGSSYPIKLVELNQDNLLDSLETLEFLVIDNYDTSVFTSDETAALEEWNKDGGILIVGTGRRAEDTLAGLDYLEVEYAGMCNALDVGYEWGSFYIYADELEFASFDYSDYSYDYSYYVDSSIAALLTYKGDGAIGVLPYSLTELGKLGDDAYSYYISQSEFVYKALDYISSNSNIRYDTAPLDSTYNLAGYIRKFLSALGNGNNSLSLGFLKIIIIIYVILAGPVLYLILRFLKKRDLYWLTVPALAFMGIIIVMLAGRNLEVVRTRVYSVTVCDLSASRDCMTFMHCYDAGHEEWKLRLAPEYEYAAPNEVYVLAGSSAYHHRILKEGERLFFGTEPETSFEDTYFYAAKDMDIQNIGSIDCDTAGSLVYNRRISEVTNNTEYDFEYLAVLDEDHLWVYNGLARGETCNPDKIKEIFKINVSSGNYYYDYMEAAQDKLKAGSMDIAAALGIGINSAYNNLDTLDIAVIGVTSDYIKAVDDNCNEKAYGCFYVIQ
ncbi:MAG: hypothetical protein NC433_12565 [Clostridiales bacterium]|nr:hypothetical protein [Clostridiales bacterium]